MPVKKVKPTSKEYLISNFAPAFGVMAICVFGSFLVYKGFYNGDHPSVIDLTKISPASGDENVIYHDGNAYILIDTANIPVWSGDTETAEATQ